MYVTVVVRKQASSLPDAAVAHYDIAVVGEGPVSSLCALAHARRGARVALLEGNPKASTRLAGEWLHPPAVRMLQDLGIKFDSPSRGSVGTGFVVFPEDRSEPVVLPYPNGTLGMTYEHAALVSGLHERVAQEPGVDFYPLAKVRGVADARVYFVSNRTERSLPAERIVGADGRASVVRQSLGFTTKRVTCSRMIGVLVEGMDLPFEGYGHVVLGGPGPILVFPRGEQRVRVIVDVPLDHWVPRDRIDLLAESYAGLLPEGIRLGFIAALRGGKFQAAANEIRPRVSYGNSHRVLIGDAAGHYHLLTAVGITLGFGDAVSLAENDDFNDFNSKRLLAIRAAEFLAVGLYEVFADHRVEAAELRQAVYRNWRTSRTVRDRTMGLLACEDRSVTHLGLTFHTIALRTVARTIPRSFDAPAWRRTRDIVRALVGLFVCHSSGLCCGETAWCRERGVNVILPELWSLPRWIPLHPSNWYCHTRLIYMGDGGNIPEAV